MSEVIHTNTLNALRDTGTPNPANTHTSIQQHSKQVKGHSSWHLVEDFTATQMHIYAFFYPNLSKIFPPLLFCLSMSTDTHSQTHTCTRIPVRSFFIGSMYVLSAASSPVFYSSVPIVLTSQNRSAAKSTRECATV